MQGFYAVYYTGKAGSAAFGLLLHQGKVYAVDVAGGDVVGSYTERADGGIDLALTFSWRAGATLVTGQTLTTPQRTETRLTLSSTTLAGGVQTIDLPNGRVNVRIDKKVAL